MKNLLLLFSCLFTAASFTSCTTVKPTKWNFTSLQKVGGHSTVVLGNPKLEKAKGEQVVTFDGVDDGLLVNYNPIAGAEEFSIEVVFKPTAAWPANMEQRFLHIEDMAAQGQRRLLMELRLNNQNQWYADFFLRSENGSLTLIDSTQTHPVGEWATMTLVYKDKQLKGYVNGQLELTGEIDYLPIPASAKTSIGTRMDKRSWFNGQIRSVRVWKKALEPKKYSNYL